MRCKVLVWSGVIMYCFCNHFSLLLRSYEVGGQMQYVTFTGYITRLVSGSCQHSVTSHADGTQNIVSQCLSVFPFMFLCEEL